MKKRIAITMILTFALAIAMSTDVSILAGPDFISPFKAGPAPTIPILPPIG